jgi:hypothetical protein
MKFRRRRITQKKEFIIMSHIPPGPVTSVLKMAEIHYPVNGCKRFLRDGNYLPHYAVLESRNSNFRLMAVVYGEQGSQTLFSPVHLMRPDYRSFSSHKFCPGHCRRIFLKFRVFISTGLKAENGLLLLDGNVRCTSGK